MIANNILLQLKSEETVFINDLGAFHKQLISAKTVKGKMQPPKYKLVFDKKVEGNGFNFVLKLSKNEKLRITDADKLVRQWVIDLKQNLSENNSYTIEDFGTFSLLKNGKISFKSGELSLLNREFEGMEEVELPEVAVEEKEEKEKEKEEEEEEKKEKEKEEKEEKGEVEKKNIEVNKVVEPIFLETSTMEETLIKKKNHSLWWLFVLIILLALALLLMLFREPICQYVSTLKEKFIAYQQAYTQQDKTNTISNPDTVALASPDTVTEFTNPEPVEPAVEPKTTAPQKPVTLPQRIVEQPTAQITVTAEQITFQPGKFYLISGSFNTLVKAQKHINESGFNKYHATILRQTGNDRYRVCMGIFENEADAERYRMLLNIPGWVLKE